MNPTTAPSVNRSSALRALFWIALTLLLPSVMLGLLILGVASCFHLSSDTRALRNGLMKASGAEWRQVICLNVGGMTLGAARAGLAFVTLDAQARTALSIVRSGELGIYQLTSERPLPDSAGMLEAADRFLSDRNWERVVGVSDGEDLVCVYLPATPISREHAKLCVLVFDGRQMILVRANANLEPLMELLRTQTGLPAKLPSRAARCWVSGSGARSADAGRICPSNFFALGQIAGEALFPPNEPTTRGDPQADSGTR